MSIELQIDKAEESSSDEEDDARARPAPVRSLNLPQLPTAPGTMAPRTLVKHPNMH